MAGSRPHRPRRRMDDDEAESLTEILHLRDYWRTVRKRIWTLITAFSLIVGSVTLATLLMSPVYEATASLQIDAQPQAYTNINAIGQFGSGQYLSDQEYFNTQHKKLRSRVQARAVLDRLNLYEHPDFADAEDPVELLLDMITIEPIAKTRLVRIYVRSTDVEMAQQICQTWLEVFVARNMDELNQGVRENIRFLSQAVDEAIGEMGKAEQELSALRREKRGIALSTEEQANAATQKLDELNRAQGQTRAEVAARKAEYENLARILNVESDPVRLSLQVNSELMGKLRQQYTDLVVERESLSIRLGPQHPEMVKVQQKIVDTSTQILAELRAELARRKEALALAEQKDEELGAAIDAVIMEALTNNDAEADYSLRRRQVETKTAHYRQLQERLNEMATTERLKENNVRIIDPAEAKSDPVEPSYVRNIGVAILAGLLTGVSLALFFDYMDTTIKTREEVEALGVPFLGIIPSVPGLEGEGWELARERYLYSHKYPKSAFAEFCRNIRTNINFSAREDGKPPRRLLITSAGPREGKTTTSINLGITFAAAGRRVCIVDADLRRPSLHHAFGLPNENGFSTLIDGTAEVADVIHPTPQDGLFVVPSGRRPDNPAEMLGSQACLAAMDKLNEAFDLVIVDSPPVVAVTDAVVLSRHVDGVVMVVKSFKAVRDLVMQAKRQLSDVEARIIGVILNDFDIRRKSYGYYYYYNYYGADREEVGRKRVRAQT